MKINELKNLDEALPVNPAGLEKIGIKPNVATSIAGKEVKTLSQADKLRAASANPNVPKPGQSKEAQDFIKQQADLKAQNAAAAAKGNAPRGAEPRFTQAPPPKKGVSTGTKVAGGTVAAAGLTAGGLALKPSADKTSPATTTPGNKLTPAEIERRNSEILGGKDIDSSGNTVTKPNTNPATTTTGNKPQQNLGYKGNQGAQSLMALNPDKIKNVNQIKAGDSIDLGGGNMYKIQKGDTLDKIAQRMTRPSGQPRAELDKPDSVLPRELEKPPAPAPEPVKPEPVAPPVTSMDDSDDARANAFVDPAGQNAVNQTNTNILQAITKPPEPTQAATTTPAPEPVKGTPENPYDKGPEVKNASGETWKDREGNAIRTRSDAEIGDTDRFGKVTPGSYDKNRAQGEKNLQGLKNFFGIKEELNRIRELSGMSQLTEAPVSQTAPTTATNASSLRAMQNQAGTQKGTTGPAAPVGQPAGAGSAKVTPQVAPAQSAMNQVKPPAATPAVTSAGASGPPGSFQRGAGIQAATVGGGRGNAQAELAARRAAPTQTATTTPPNMGAAMAAAGGTSAKQPPSAGGGRGFVNPTMPKTQAATTAPAAKPQPQGPAVGSQAQTAGGANELAKTGIMGGQPAPTAAPANPGTQSAGIGFNQGNLGTRAPAETPSAFNQGALGTRAPATQPTSGSPMAGVNAGSGTANNTTMAPQQAPAQSAMNQSSNTQAATTSGSPMAGVSNASSLRTAQNNAGSQTGTTAGPAGSGSPMAGVKSPAPTTSGDADMAEFQRDKADMLGKGVQPNQGGPETQATRDFEESIMRESTMELNQLRKFSGLPELTESEVTVHKGTYGNSYGKEDVRDQYGHKIGKVDKGSEAKKDAPKRGRGRPTKGDKDEHGNDTKFDTSGLQGMLGGKPKGEVGKKSVKHSLKDWMEVVSDNMINESEIDGDKEEPMKKAIGDKWKPAKTSNAFTQTAPYPSFKKKNPVAKKVKETKDLPGDQDDLDVAPPKGKLTSADFKALGDKKKVSEARVMEESEYTYEKIGKILAQENPTLASDSDEFANAVYHEMIQMGMTPKSAHYKLNHDPDFLGEVVTAYHHYLGQGTVDEAKTNTNGMGQTPPYMPPKKPENGMGSIVQGTWQSNPRGTVKAPSGDPEGVKEAGSFIRNLASSRRAFEGKNMKDLQLESWDKELDSLLNENLTISTTIDDQGHDSVNVSATEGNAHEIIELLRNAGLGGLGGAKQEHGQEVNNYGLPMSGDEHQGPEAQLIAVGDPHAHDSMGDEGGDDMMALIKKMTGIEDSGEEHNHEEHEGECETCGESPCACDDEPEKVDEAGVEEGNEFSGNRAEAVKNHQSSFEVDGKEYPVQEANDGNLANNAKPYDEVTQGDVVSGRLGQDEQGGKEEVDEGQETCNECGYPMESCGCDYEEVNESAASQYDSETQERIKAATPKQLSQMAYEFGGDPSHYEHELKMLQQAKAELSRQLEEYANDADDTADQDLEFMMRTLSGGGGMGEKRSQSTAPIIKIVTAEGTLMKDSTDLLSDFRKLSGI